MNTSLRTALLASALLALPFASQAAVVDFDSYPAPRDFLQSATVGDLTFTYSGTAGNRDGDMAIWSGNSPHSNGTNNLIFTDWGTTNTVTITRTDGANFDLNSIDLAISWYSSTVANSLFINGIETFINTTLSTYTLNLQNVSSVVLSGLSNDDSYGDSIGFWVADNINYGTATVATVPVPAAGLMLMGALGGLAAVRRRKTTAA